MRAANWKDYELLDTSAGERLERWGEVILIRPDPQIIWNTPKQLALWKQAHARYRRSSTGGGAWQILKKVPPVWKISYGDLRFQLKTMGFKHTGVFPEQAVNWDFTGNLIRNAPKPLKVLNLFAYTGGATLACAQAGASVCHGRVEGDGGMGCEKTPRRPAFQIGRSAGWWMTALNLSRESSGEETGTTVLSWTLHPMEEVPAARCGSWRSSCFLWWNCAGAYCLPTLSFFC